MMKDLGHLRTFFEVARAGGVTRAQRALGVGQPTISKAVQSLEKELRLVLFERHKRGVTLTPAGQRLFETCQRAFAELDRVEAIADEEREECAGDLTIATHEHVASELLPPVVARLRKQHPRVTPRIFTGPAHLFVPGILKGDSELGLFLKVEKSTRLDMRALAKVPCKVVIAKEHASDRAVQASFIGSREVDDLRNRKFPTVAMLKRHVPETSITISCNSLDAHRKMVLAGCGVSVLPTFVVESDLRAGRLVTLHAEYTYMATLHWVTRRGKVPSKPAHAFMKLLRAELAGRELTK